MPARAAASWAAAAWGTIRHPMVKIEAPSQLAEKLEARARARAAALATLEAELVGRVRRIRVYQPGIRVHPRVVTMTIVVVVTMIRCSIPRKEENIPAINIFPLFSFPNEKVSRDR